MDAMHPDAALHPAQSRARGGDSGLDHGREAARRFMMKVGAPRFVLPVTHFT